MGKERKERRTFLTHALLSFFGSCCQRVVGPPRTEEMEKGLGIRRALNLFFALWRIPDSIALDLLLFYHPSYLFLLRDTLDRPSSSSSSKSRLWRLPIPLDPPPPFYFAPGCKYTSSSLTPQGHLFFPGNLLAFVSLPLVVRAIG